MIYKNDSNKKGEILKVKMTANQLAKELIKDTIYGMICAWSERTDCANDLTDREYQMILDALLNQERRILKTLNIKK